MGTYEGLGPALAKQLGPDFMLGNNSSGNIPRAKMQDRAGRYLGSGAPSGGRGADVGTSAQGATDLRGPTRKLLLGE